MTTNMKKPSKGLVIIYVVIVMLLLAGLVALIGIVREKLYTFEVEYAEGNAYCNNDAVYLSSGQEAFFKVVYLNKNGEPMQEDFTVKIVPANADDAEVTYKLGEDIKTSKFSEIENFNAYFSLEKRGDGFSITAPKNFSVEDAIKNSNPERKVTILSEVNYSSLHFKAEIKSFDGKEMVKVYFDQYFKVEYVETEPCIEFGGIVS